MSKLNVCSNHLALSFTIQMEEQYPKPIAPYVRGSLVKTNDSISVTRKILSESIHEFHGDFEGNKIWKINTAPNGEPSYYSFLFDKYLILWSRTHLYLHDKDSGKLIKSITHKHLYKKGSYEEDDNDIVGLIREETLEGSLVFLITKMTYPPVFLYKIRLPDLTIEAEMPYPFKGYANVWAVTPDNKFILIITRQFRERKQFHLVNLLSSKTLEIVNSYEIFLSDFDISFPTLIPGSNLILSSTNDGVICWDYQKGVLVNSFNDDNIVYPYSSGRQIANVDYNLMNGLFVYPAKNGSRINLYNFKTKQLVREFELPEISTDPTVTTRFSNNGNYLLVWNHKLVNIYDIKTFNLIAVLADFYSYDGIDYLQNGYPADRGFRKAFFDLEDKFIYTLGYEGEVYKWK